MVFYDDDLLAGGWWIAETVRKWASHGRELRRFVLTQVKNWNNIFQCTQKPNLNKVHQ